MRERCMHNDSDLNKHFNLLAKERKQQMSNRDVGRWEWQCPTLDAPAPASNTSGCFRSFTGAQMD